VWVRQRLAIWRDDAEHAGDLGLGVAGGKQLAACMRRCWNAWRLRSVRALRRQAVGLIPPCCQDSPDPVTGRGELL
jgi:hypothetical protein